jgi:hypothetical protein
MWALLGKESADGDSATKISRAQERRLLGSEFIRLTGRSWPPAASPSMNLLSSTSITSSGKKQNGMVPFDGVRIGVVIVVEIFEGSLCQYIWKFLRDLASILSMPTLWSALGQAGDIVASTILMSS